MILRLLRAMPYYYVFVYDLVEVACGRAGVCISTALAIQWDQLLG